MEKEDLKNLPWFPPFPGLRSPGMRLALGQLGNRGRNSLVSELPSFWGLFVTKL